MYIYTNPICSTGQLAILDGTGVGFRQIFGPGPSTTLFRDATTIDEAWALGAAILGGSGVWVDGDPKISCSNFQCLDLSYNHQYPNSGKWV